VNAATLALTGDLADELDANEREPVDPRTVPCRYSALKQFASSPLHYWHAMQDTFEETLSMRLGSGAHALLFGQPLVVWTGKTRNGKAWEQFRDDHASAGHLILSQSELAKAEAMCAALRSNALAMSVLFGPGMVHEERIDWTWNGRAYRSTPDGASKTVLADLKCLRSSKPDDVMWQSKKAQYHAQAAMYRRALNERGASIGDCFLVVVENKAPHPVTVMRFTEAALEQGERSLVLWDEQRRACEQAGEYPGYVQSIVDLDLPGDDGMAGLVFGDDDNASNEGNEAA
jgi:hypothetical protein